MTAANAVFKPIVVDAAARHLEAFALANTEAKLVVLTSGDGFEIAAYPASAVAARVAAMSSSMQALSQALTREVGIGRNRSLIVETDAGAALILDLDEALPRASLAVVAAGKEPLGKLLWAARNLCKQLEKSLAQ